MSKLREKLFKKYKLEELGFDFMGYSFTTKNELSTHHIIPKHQGGTTKDNNLCVLNRFSSHNYIHLIEDYDYKTFLQISRLLFAQVQEKQLTMERIAEINSLLDFFEQKYQNEQTRNGETLIRPEYKARILKP